MSGGCFESTTTTTTTTIVVNTLTSTSTSTTTTTIPIGCDGAPSLASLNCRLNALIAEVDGAGVDPKLEQPLLRLLRKAKASKDGAEAKLQAGKVRAAMNSLKVSRRKVQRFAAKLRSLRGRRALPEESRSVWLNEATGIISGISTVRAELG